MPRVVRLQVPLAAVDGSGTLPAREIVLEAPMCQYVPKRLEATALVGYEQHALECFLALVGTAGPGAVLDVGANVGLYGLLAATTSHRDVRAFEPTPDLAAVARGTAERNDLRMVVEELALGREAGAATFFLSDRSDSSNSLAEGYRESSRQLNVAVETLDGYCARTGVVPAVLKVDTETTEPDVLAGAAGTIAAHRPWIMCEVLHGRREGELAEVMAPHGYTWYHLRGEDDPEPVDSLDGDPEYGDLMYLLAPEPVDAAFWELTRAWRAALQASHDAAANAEPPAPGSTPPGTSGETPADTAADAAAAAAPARTLDVRPAASPEAVRALPGAPAPLPDDRLVLRGARPREAVDEVTGMR
jgi:FkbM family methyltransferase